MTANTALENNCIAHSISNNEELPLEHLDLNDVPYFGEEIQAPPSPIQVGSLKGSQSHRTAKILGPALETIYAVQLFIVLFNMLSTYYLSLLTVLSFYLSHSMTSMSIVNDYPRTEQW